MRAIGVTEFGGPEKLHVVELPDPVAGPRWFGGARLNFAENLLPFRDHRPALLCQEVG